MNGKVVGGQITQVRVFMALALGILIIACINFRNLATARSQKRAKEVGIKKTMGASRKSLVTQFLLESLLLTIISVILAVVLVELALPKFNQLLNIELSIAYGSIYNLIVKTVLVALVIALPAAYFMMNHWLTQFDYRITIGWSVFILTAFLTVFIALSTVSWQAFRAAKSNPVDALKYE